MRSKLTAIFVGLLFCASGAMISARASPSLNGTWKGVYFVYPNLMTLELDLSSSSGGAITGVLKYSPAAQPQQRGALGAPKQGSYKVSGQYDEPSHTFVLKPGAWIEKSEMVGQTAPLVGVFDVRAESLAGVFEFKSMTAPVTFVLATDAKGDQLIADIIRSAYPAPLTAAQRAQEEEARKRKLAAQAGANNPDVQKMYDKAAARAAEGQRQRLEQQLEQLNKMQNSERGNADAMKKARDNLQARLDALPGGPNDPTKTEVWAAPPLDKMLDWLSPLKRELAALKLENAAMERIYVPAYNLFEDGYFKAHFGLTYEEMDVMKRKAVAAVINEHGKDLYSVFMQRPFQNVGDFGAPDVTVSIYWQRVTRAWLADVPATFAGMSAEPNSFSHLTAAESTAKDVLPLLWSNDKETFNTALAGTRTRLAGPALSLKVDQLIAAAHDIAGARDLTTWNMREKDLLPYVSATERDKIQQRVDGRVDGIIDGLLVDERRQVGALGSGLRAVESGSAWYGRFTRDYQAFLRRSACENVLSAFQQRRPGDLAGVAGEMVATIRSGYDKLSWDDTSQAEQGRVQFANELARHLGQWFVVPGDNSSDTAKKVYAVAGELGGKVKDLLPPSKRAQLHFASLSETRSDHQAGTQRQRLPVRVELLATADNADDSETLRELLPMPIVDAGFDFGTDICWAIFHGRFDDIRSATAAQPGFGSQLSAAVRNTNPQFHYAFISFVGLSSQRWGDKQIGPSTTMIWTTYTINPDGTRVDQEGSDHNPVTIPVIFSKFYEDSYNIAHASADGDGLFGNNPLGYLQTAAKLMKNGFLSEAGTRADGSFSIAQANWERPILSDINALFDAWPVQSSGIWQFQENIKRYLNGQKSLQALWALTREANGWSDLYVAARRDDAALVTKLLSQGAQVNVKDRYGRTPLHLAALDGSTEAIDALVRAGGDVNARSNIGETPLKYAVTYDAAAAISRLLAGKASPDLADEKGFTPLSDAAQLGYLGSMGLLLEGGASTTLVDKSGMNVLDHAVAGDQVEVLRVLLSRPGVNVQAKSKEGWNALHFAAKANAKRAIGELIAKGLDVNGKTAQGYTPLHLAAINGSIEAIGALILRGADLQAKDAAGRTPLDEAIANNNEPVMLALRGQGQPSH